MTQSFETDPFKGHPREDSHASPARAGRKAHGRIRMHRPPARDGKLTGGFACIARPRETESSREDSQASPARAGRKAHGRIRMHRPPAREAGDKGIHQCAHWFMHRPPACARKIRILPGMKRTIPGGMVLFMAPTGGFEPLACRLGGGRSILLSYVGKLQA